MMVLVNMQLLVLGLFDEMFSLKYNAKDIV
jgi:hypothetical protein